LLPPFPFGPILLGALNVTLLRRFIAAAEQDHHNCAVATDVGAMARTNVNP